MRALMRTLNGPAFVTGCHSILACRHRLFFFALKWPAMERWPNKPSVILTRLCIASVANAPLSAFLPPPSKDSLLSSRLASSSLS